MRELAIRNTQRARRLRSSLLRQITRHLLEEILALEDYQLAVHIVSARKMAQLNWDFLQHEGSTDVITFDYREGYEAEAGSANLHGEIYISSDDAVSQAKEFRATWTEELVRYIVHGVLHLQGHDDLSPGPRKIMKREEGKLLRKLAARFCFREIAV